MSYHLGLLERDGSLRRGAGQPRTLTGPGRPAPRDGDDDAVVPLIGQIADGDLVVIRQQPTAENAR